MVYPVDIPTWVFGTFLVADKHLSEQEWPVFLPLLSFLTCSGFSLAHPVVIVPFVIS